MINPSFNTPILFLIFNRPDLTLKVFKKIKDIKPKQLFIAADGPREIDSEKSACLETRAVVENVDWPCEVKKLYRDENLGCRQAVSQAIDWFFDNIDHGIILEDDCLPNGSFFWFCQKLLDYYKDDSRIQMISGNNLQNGIIRGDGSYYFTKHCHLWGWATWKDAWKNYDGNMSSFPKFRESSQIENIFSEEKEQKYWMKRFERTYNGEVNSWAYRWMYSVFKSNGLSIVPNKNLVENIGFDHKEATHPSPKAKRYLDIMQTAELEGEIKHPEYFLPLREAEIYTLKALYNKDVKKRKKKKGKIDKFAKKFNLRRQNSNHE